MNPYVLIAAFVAGISLGWLTHGWKSDSSELASTQAIAKVEKTVSNILEDKLSNIKANRTEIVRENTKIVNNPVYINNCLDDRGVQSINLSNVQQQNLLQKCADLPDLKGTTGADILPVMTEWGLMYSECQARHNTLVEFAK